MLPDAALDALPAPHDPIVKGRLLGPGGVEGYTDEGVDANMSSDEVEGR